MRAGRKAAVMSSRTVTPYSLWLARGCRRLRSHWCNWSTAQLTGGIPPAAVVNASGIFPSA